MKKSFFIVLSLILLVFSASWAQSSPSAPDTVPEQTIQKESKSGKFKGVLANAVEAIKQITATSIEKVNKTADVAAEKLKETAGKAKEAADVAVDRVKETSDAAVENVKKTANAAEAVSSAVTQQTRTHTLFLFLIATTFSISAERVCAFNLWISFICFLYKSSFDSSL